MLGNKKELARKSESSGTMAPWRPFREFQELRNILSSTLEDFFGESREFPFELASGRLWAPAVDVEESDKEYTFEVELPGLDRNDFKVEMQNGMLRISGERREKREDKGQHYLRHEQYYGTFRRDFTMPSDANPEGVKAAYKNGILTVTVPRSEKAKPKAIPISEE